MAELDLAGRRLSFLSTLRKQAVSQAELYAMSYEAGQVAARLMQENPAGAGAFTIECLYLNLNDVNVVSDFRISPPPGDRDQLDRLRLTAYPESVSGSVEKKREIVRTLEDKIAVLMGKFFRQKGRRFLVNTTVRPRVPKRDPSFIVSDLRFKVTRAPAASPQAFPSSIDYLAVVENGLKMPDDGQPLDSARAKLASWVTPDRVSGRQALAAGVMVLRGAKVSGLLRSSLESGIRDEYARMEKANNGVSENGAYPEAKLFSNATVEATGNRITVKSVDGNNTYNWTGKEDGDDIKFKLVKSLSFSLTPTKGRCYDVSGEYKITLSRTRDVFAGSQWASGEKTVHITGNMVLKAVSDGFKCDIRPTLTLSFRDGEQVMQGKASNFLVDAFGNNKWDRSQVEGFSSFIKGQIERMLIESCSKINVGFKDFAMIPPAEEVFTFARPRFSAGGDLLLDIVYRAVLG